MLRPLRIPAGAVALTLVLSLVPAPSTAAQAPGSFVTDPAAGSPQEIAVGYIGEHLGELGLTPADLADLVVSNEYRTKHNGVTHLYLQQRLGGVEVVNGIFNVNVMSDGRILNLGNRFVGDLAGAANAVAPSLEPEEAVASAAEHLGLEMGEGALAVLEVLGGRSMAVRFNDAGISRGDISAELKYLPRPNGAVRLVWSLMVSPLATSDVWNVFVDTETGDVLDKFNWTVNEAPNRALGATPERGALVARGTAEFTPDSYEVYAIPKESPLDGPRTIEANPADSVASPFGWHDTDGAPGAESTLTVGNNVQAQTDINANNVPGPPDIQPDGGPTLDFLFPIDLNMQPDTYQPAAVTNLFYWNNVMHDLTYHYGFDPVSGNFQDNNYGLGGVGSDPVQADAQDGSGTDNANFSTPPDGFDPRMQMFIWTNPFGQLVTVNAPAPIADSYVANPSNSGGTGNGLTADLEIVDDGVPPATDACEPVLNDLTGKIALIVWSEGLCNSSVFVANAANAGAVGAVLVDNQEVPFTNFGGSSLIPSVAVGSIDGQLFIDTIDGGDTVNATLEDNPAGAINRDSDLDNGIIAHEYGHGISNRLTGGPGNVGCLFHSEQAGEGWSDWWSLALFPLPSDTRTTIRGIGNYATFRPIDGDGIRNFPYSTDMTVNPQTYADIGTTNVPHGVGEIWAAMLWEVYWNLVDKHGFDEDLYTGTGGNNLAIQLVMDGMKLQPCVPTFVDARDAILAADTANNGGENHDEIWCGFSKRGLGLSASAGGTGVGDETEAFDVPDGVTCGQPCGLRVRAKSPKWRAGEVIEVDLDLHHNRAKTVTVPFRVWVQNAFGAVIVSRTTRPVTMQQGDKVKRTITLALPDDLPPGDYSVRAEVEEMQQGTVRAGGTGRIQ